VSLSIFRCHGRLLRPDIAEKDLVLLVRHEYFGHRLHVSRLADREQMAKKSGFRLIGGGKNTKLVEYDVSIEGKPHSVLLIQRDIHSSATNMNESYNHSKTSRTDCIGS